MIAKRPEQSERSDEPANPVDDRVTRTRPLRTAGTALKRATQTGRLGVLLVGLAISGLTPSVAMAQTDNLLPATTSNPFDTPERDLPPGAAYSAYQQGHYLTAFSLATELAGKGEVSAQTLLGELYLGGLGVIQDIKEAANWFTLAANNGDREAQLQLGLLYARGQGVGKDIKKAIDLFEKAAAQGQKNAQFNLAFLYLQGQHVRRDQVKAQALFTKAAKQGLPDAQYALANIFSSELNVTPQLDKAAYWMHQAAQGGFKDAQLEYGLMLFKGNGVEKNYDEARKWLTRAADGGHVLAQNRLARILAHGFGAPADPEGAAYYYLLSLKAGKKDEWLEAFYQALPEKTKTAARSRAATRSPWQ